jgi:hypothetical protein
MLFNVIQTYLHYLPGSRIYHIYTPIYTISTPPSCWVSLHAFNPVHIDDLKVLLFDSVEGCRFSSANNLIYIFIHTYMYTYNYINYIYISYIYIRQVEWWRRGFKCGPSQVEQYQSPPVIGSGKGSTEGDHLWSYRTSMYKSIFNGLVYIRENLQEPSIFHGNIHSFL